MSRFRSVSPGLLSFREKALLFTEKLANLSKVQSEPHLPSDVVLGQLVTERIGLEDGIVLSWGGGGQALLGGGGPTPVFPIFPHPQIQIFCMFNGD